MKVSEALGEPERCRGRRRQTGCLARRSRRAPDPARVTDWGTTGGPPSHQPLSGYQDLLGPVGQELT